MMPNESRTSAKHVASWPRSHQPAARGKPSYVISPSGVRSRPFSAASMKCACRPATAGVDSVSEVSRDGALVAPTASRPMIRRTRGSPGRSWGRWPGATHPGGMHQRYQAHVSQGEVTPSSPCGARCQPRPGNRLRLFLLPCPRYGTPPRRSRHDLELFLHGLRQRLTQRRTPHTSIKPRSVPATLTGGTAPRLASALAAVER